MRVTPDRLAKAPCNRPCAAASTRRLINAWKAGPAKPQIAHATLTPSMRGDEHPKRALLRTSRAQTIERLSNGFARDELGLEEFEERLNRAYAASAVTELHALVGDLSPETAVVVLDAALEPVATTSLLPVVAAPRAVAILGSVERSGQLAAKVSGALAVLGSVVIDLREVSLPAGVTTIQVSALLGSVEIIVPPNLAVESEGACILGSFEGLQRVPHDPDPELPVLHVQGRAVLGSIEIRTQVSASGLTRARLPAKR
jgi:Cell wall-active antibiotics response 4TMS YvqF/Domain of unknown function (DUF1707)